MTVSEVLVEFGRNWDCLSTLGAPFLERVDFWAGVVSRRSTKNPESFPEATLSQSIFGFIRSSSSRPKYRNRPLEEEIKGLHNRFPVSTVAQKGLPLPHEEFVDAVCWGKTPQTSSIIRRLARGEKIPDIAEALGISSQGVITAVGNGTKGGAK